MTDNSHSFHELLVSGQTLQQLWFLNTRLIAGENAVISLSEGAHFQV
jgi:hypothetical protein